jgi:nicotinate-nucleotide adenylyltransferase
VSRRLGIFGGTFDPPHNGHLVLATEALEQLNLDGILWVLTPYPPHKPNQLISPWGDRFDMLRAAIEPREEFMLSRVDIERPGPHYAVDTVRLLQAQYPGDKLVYLMGEDSLRDLSAWHKPNVFVNSCHSLGIMRRPETELSLETVEAQIAGITQKVEFIDVAAMSVSSSQIRAQIKTGNSCPDDLNPAVYKIIQSRGLYR